MSAQGTMLEKGIQHLDIAEILSFQILEAFYFKGTVYKRMEGREGGGRTLQ